MSIPALRRPKRLSKETAKNKTVSKLDSQFVILTLKNGMKLVISSDTFHGIIMMGEMYKCVLCDIEIEPQYKESHKVLLEHKKFISTYPYIEDLSENLVRQLDKMQCYCTICNVTTSTVFVMRHIRTDEHVNELNRAIQRGKTYQPCDENNN